MSETDPKDNELSRVEEAVDPRVQIELERLNAATDDINKLEVDLDEARTNFRQLLYDSSVKIDSLGKKLGNCVEKARPYYEARIKAKEALHETQMAAVRFERANSAHSAAKEMVYLAEEGLCAEGRTFDHAWQEMLNHATMRVNESELERTVSEVEHRRTSQSYQQAEIIVQQLQKELKRCIAKSSFNPNRALFLCNVLASTLVLNGLPYFELKAQFNNLLEEQKNKVKKLEVKVSSAKASYAEALQNLEQISDEIHRIRKNNVELGFGARVTGVGADSPLTPDTRNVSTVSSSTGNADTDRWTDSVSSSDSEEYLRLPDKLGPSSSPTVPKNVHQDTSYQSNYLSLSFLLDRNAKSSSSQHTEDAVRSAECSSISSHIQSTQPYHLLERRGCSRDNVDSGETSDEDNVVQSLFSKMVPAKLRAPPVSNNLSDDVSVKDLTGVETWSEVSLTSPEYEQPKGEVWTEVNLNDCSSPSSDLHDLQDSKITSTEETNATNKKSKPDSSLATWISRSSVEQCSNSRRQSLDTLIMGGLATGERVKEIFSQGIMKLNISSLTDRRPSEERSTVRVATKKVPSPLEKSMVYLHHEDDSTSDSESLASVEMLTDDQISSLMLDHKLHDTC